MGERTLWLFGDVFLLHPRDPEKRYVGGVSNCALTVPAGHGTGPLRSYKFLTDSKGQYYFRTIKPVPYPGRTPHIHVAVNRNGRRILTTQMLINGHEANDRDGLVKRVKDRKELLETLLVDWKPLPGSKLGEWTANFDIVLGRTARELEDGSFGGGLGKPDGRG